MADLCDGSARDVTESAWLSREIMLCLERVNVSLRDSEVAELNGGIADDSGDEKRKAKGVHWQHGITMSHV